MILAAPNSPIDFLVCLNAFHKESVESHAHLGVCFSPVSLVDQV